jgi:hypothetical protein
MSQLFVADELWELAKTLLSAAKSRRFRYPGPKPVGNRIALTTILFVLKSGTNCIRFS